MSLLILQIFNSGGNFIPYLVLLTKCLLSIIIIHHPYKTFPFMDDMLFYLLFSIQHPSTLKFILNEKACQGTAGLYNMSLCNYYNSAPHIKSIPNPGLSGTVIFPFFKKYPEKSMPSVSSTTPSIVVTFSHAAAKEAV